MLIIIELVLTVGLVLICVHSRDVQPTPSSRGKFRLQCISERGQEGEGAGSILVLQSQVQAVLLHLTL